MPLVHKPAGLEKARAPDRAAVSKGLASASPEARWVAARAAAEVPGVTAEVAAALAVENDPRVREAMFTTLARSGTDELAAHLLPLLRSSEAALRTGALDALRAFPPAAQELLPALLRDGSADVRILSCELARSLPSAEATRQLSALLLDEQDVNVCAAAIDVLAEVGNAQVVAILARCGQRFAHVPFLCFAIEVTTQRLTSGPAAERG